MLAKRIIPCLDVKDGRTVKGVNFVGLRDAGDPVEMGRIYSDQMADELVFLDITASVEGRKTFTEMVKRVATELSIPFTVGGGVGSLADVECLLNAGADKVAVNSAALKKPELIDDIATHFGSQICVLAIDAKYDNGEWKCYLNGGRTPTDKNLFEWAREGYNRDGTKEGFANDALKKISEEVGIPLIASGGAGKKEDFRDAFLEGHADAALAASVFHYGEIKIPELKKYLHGEGIEVRL